MSEKQAKKKRREEAQKVVKIGTISIDVYSNFDVNVSNFPTEHNIAMMIMANAMLKVSNFFMAQKNDKPNILLAKEGVSKADIIKMAQKN